MNYKLTLWGADARRVEESYWDSLAEARKVAKIASRRSNVYSATIQDPPRHLSPSGVLMNQERKKEKCPLCGESVTRGAELSGDTEDDHRVCQYCMWDDYERCAHGVIEGEFCINCPGGGW